MLRHCGFAVVVLGCVWLCDAIVSSLAAPADQEDSEDDETDDRTAADSPSNDCG